MARRGITSGIQNLRQTDSQNETEECVTLRVAAAEAAAGFEESASSASLSSEEGMRRLGPYSIVVRFTPLLDVTP